MKRITLLLFFAIVMASAATTSAQTFRKITKDTTFIFSQSVFTANSDFMKWSESAFTLKSARCGHTFTEADPGCDVKTPRSITLAVQNVDSFDLVVGNNAARYYTCKINDAAASEHAADCAITQRFRTGTAGNVTIVIGAKENASVTPVSIRYYPVPEETEEPEEPETPEDTVVFTTDFSSDFSSGTAWEFGTCATGGTNASFSANVSNAGGTYGNVLNLNFSGANGNRTVCHTFDSVIATPENQKLYLDFDWQLGVPTTRNTSGIIMRFKDSAGNVALALSVESSHGASGNALHLLNLDNTVTDDPTAASTYIAPTAGTGTFARGTWVHVYAVLNYKKHKLDTIKITNVTAEYLAVGVPFYSSSAADLSIMELYLKRDGTTVSWTGQIDNFTVKHNNKMETPYEEFVGYVEVVQDTHNAETGTAPFVAAMKATLQTAIDAAKSSVTSSSSESQINAAAAALEAALASFNNSKAQYEALQASVAQASARYTAASARAGEELQNYTRSALDALNTAIAAANAAASTVTANDALNAAKTAIDNALTAFNSATRSYTEGVPYRIYTYGTDAGDRNNDKKILYSDGNNLLFSAVDTVENDVWFITKTATGAFTIRNYFTDQYISSSGNGNNDPVQVSGSPAEFLLEDGKIQNGSIYIDTTYFLYSILINDGNRRALEVNNYITSTDTVYNCFTQRNGYADRGRFVFQFEPLAQPNGLPVKLVSATPAAGATGVAVNTGVEVTFKAPLDGIVDAHFISINSRTGGVSNPAVSYSGNKLAIAYNELAPNTEYTVIISANSIVGLAEDITWKFTTGNAVITATGFAPTASTSNVAVDARLQVTFNKNPYLNGTIPNWNLVTVKDAAGNAVSGIMVLADGFNGNTYNIQHARLLPSTVYTVTIPKETVTGQAADYTWTFTTAAPAAAGQADVAKLKIYPTVTDGQVQIFNAGKAQIRISDLTGRTVETANIEGDHQIDLSGRASGIYFVTLTIDGKTTVNKIIKK